MLHEFACAKADVQRLAEAAARIAAGRRKRMTVIAEDSGLPEITRVWNECAERAGEACGVEVRRMDIDFAAYQLIARPEEFDVIATPNCYGDILADLGWLFLGSRGATFGGSFPGGATPFSKPITAPRTISRRKMWRIPPGRFSR